MAVQLDARLLSLAVEESGARPRQLTDLGIGDHLANHRGVLARGVNPRRGLLFEQRHLGSRLVAQVVGGRGTRQPGPDHTVAGGHLGFDSLGCLKRALTQSLGVRASYFRRRTTSRPSRCLCLR